MWMSNKAFPIQDIRFSRTAWPQVQLTELATVMLVLKGNEAYAAASEA
jgi:hypothetical protein